MDELTIPDAVEPAAWFVVFHPKSTLPWLDRLPVGRFKHVSAFGYIAGFKGWMFVASSQDGLRPSMVSDAATKIAFKAYLDAGCAVVKIERRIGVSMPARARLGFTCVTAIAHLTSIGCVAITPDGLYKAILRNGGLLISGPTPQSPDRSESGRRAGAGSE